MSGLIGVFERQNTGLDPTVLSRMTAVMSHRGPDGMRHWQEGRVGLGHCMLHSTPESLHETLPLSDKHSGLAITADARIDNRQELISALRLKRRHPSTITDSELILGAYQKWAEQCVDHLIGDFAFLIWDAHKQQLFGARDHL